MSSHADTIRMYLNAEVLDLPPSEFQAKAEAALDALLAENQRLRDAAQTYVDAELADEDAMRALVYSSHGSEQLHQAATRKAADAAFKNLREALAGDAAYHERKLSEAGQQEDYGIDDV